jgi:hypothetical protein
MLDSSTLCWFLPMWMRMHSLPYSITQSSSVPAAAAAAAHRERCSKPQWLQLTRSPRACLGKQQQQQQQRWQQIVRMHSLPYTITQSSSVPAAAAAAAATTVVILCAMPRMWIPETFIWRCRRSVGGASSDAPPKLFNPGINLSTKFSIMDLTN